MRERKENYTAKEPHWVDLGPERRERIPVDDRIKYHKKYNAAYYAYMRESGYKVPDQDADVATFALDTFRRKFIKNLKASWRFGAITKE